MENEKKNGFAIAAFILSLVGFLTSCVKIGIVFCIIGLVFAIIGMQKPKKGLAIAGLIISIVGILIALIVMIATGSSSDSSTDNSEETVIEQSGSSEITSENIVDNSEEDTESAEDGSMITVGSSFESYGLTITVNDADTDFQDYENDYGFNTPNDGMKYIMVSFTFENNGDSDAYVSIYDFDCYADNSTCEQVYSLDDSDFINTNLSSGRNISFKTYYEVPINAESIELEYETNMWTEEKVIIKIQ